MLKMRLKQVFVILGLAFGFIAVHAQGVTHEMIQFEETTHEFGTAEQGTKTETVFKFKNNSSEIVKLTGVKAACGCTTPEWSKEEIAPGATGEIKVSYNSERVGVFHKSVAVNYNDIAEPITLYIKGNILAKPTGPEATVVQPAPPVVNKMIPEINYSMPRGALSFEKTVENVKGLSSEEDMNVEFRYKNTSSLPLKINKESVEVQPGISMTFKDEVLAPGQESMVKVNISGRAMKAAGDVDGYFSKNFSFHTDEAAGHKKELTISGNYKRVYTEVEKANSPRVEFATTSVEGGKIIEGEKYVYDFAFKNTGKTPLKIIAAKASCGCTAIKPITDLIAPGDSAAITATFDSKGRVGMQSKSITVTTNDIENPTIGLRFTVEVVKDPFHAGGVGGAQ
jgi:hypothetical protein